MAKILNLLCYNKRSKTNLLGDKMSFQNLPQIDKILNLECFKNAVKPILAGIARNILATQRDRIKSGENLPDTIELIAQEYAKFEKRELRALINATGVVMHTNLARSVIDERIVQRASEVITSYSNLEYNVTSGGRGNRYDYIGELLGALFGCEDALVVNNNASAVFLVLNTFAKGGETIVSRGELVEIGGSFRVPDVMREAGTTLHEVGTTNKTHLYDYQNAINERTKMLLKVHRSNFSIVGFSEEVGLGELSSLAKSANLPFYYDLGSGYVGELAHNLGKDEPSVQKLMQSGADLVSFSGDKLFSSAQAGIILGSGAMIAKLRKNQLLRMLRVDKITLAILAQSVKAYLNHEFDAFCTPRMINLSIDELTKRANFINSHLAKPLEIIQTSTYVGGGSLPNKTYPSIALKVIGDAEQNERKYRDQGVIGRIENGSFLLDIRTILPKDMQKFIKIINESEK